MSHFPESTFRRLMAGAPKLTLAQGGKDQVGGTDTVGHSSVQPWSAGDIFPATIAVIESYTYAGEYRFTAYELMLDGQSERFATYDDAVAAARMLLADPEARAAWRAGNND